MRYPFPIDFCDAVRALRPSLSFSVSFSILLVTFALIVLSTLLRSVYLWFPRFPTSQRLTISKSDTKASPRWLAVTFFFLFRVRTTTCMVFVTVDGIRVWQSKASHVFTQTRIWRAAWSEEHSEENSSEEHFPFVSLTQVGWSREKTLQNVISS